ncbi:hypothetical protein [Kineococcus sp. SYSU DK005]|uniref:hypothetical protein n=1 Tax=Kineococcus sp. SYSU DK005 TaxID=3383126 RepID=UPI003D7CB222
MGTRPRGGDDGSTLAVATDARSHAVLLVRRLAVVLLLLVVVAGAAGLFGVHSATARATGGGYALELTYPRTARAGLDAPWQLRVRAERPGGFGDSVVVAVTADYFDVWEQQGWIPAAAGETTDGEWYLMTFDPPPGDEFELTFDGYLQPGSQLGRDGRVALVVDGRRVVETAFSTWLAP